MAAHFVNANWYCWQVLIYRLGAEYEPHFRTPNDVNQSTLLVLALEVTATTSDARYARQRVKDCFNKKALEGWEWKSSPQARQQSTPSYKSAPIGGRTSNSEGTRPGYITVGFALKPAKQCNERSSQCSASPARRTVRMLTVRRAERAGRAGRNG